MNRKILFRRLTNLTTAVVLAFSGLVIENFGGTSVKTFDFGGGGDNPTFRSHSRTFLIPQDVAAAVRINYRTAGETPISIMFAIEDAGGRLLAARESFAEKAVRQLIINVPASDNLTHGCEKGWQVRVSSRDGQVPPARVFGDITLSFIDPPAARVSLERPTFDLRRGTQASLQVGTTETFGHCGVVNVKASWTHSPLAQALPLKFELVRPDGSVARSLVGYATNSSAQPKLDFEYRVVVADTRQKGVWRLRVSNTTEQEISEINPSVSFTRRCFE